MLIEVLGLMFVVRSVGYVSLYMSINVMIRKVIDGLRFAYLWSGLVVSSKFSSALRMLDETPGRIALFSWAVPPSKSAGVHRPLSLVQYAAGIDRRLTVFHGRTPERHQIKGQAGILVPGAEFVPVTDLALAPPWRFVPQIDGSALTAASFAKAAFQYYGDSPPDVVIASGPPFAMFVAASFCASKWERPLVLDYRDEWTECPFDFVEKGGENRIWEERVLTQAALVVFTTVSMLAHALRSFPILRADKCFVIPNGWDRADFNSAKLNSVSTRSANDGQFIISFIGNASGFADPTGFLVDLQDILEKYPEFRRGLKIRFVGQRSPSAAAAMANFAYPGNIEVIDHVPKVQAIRHMLDADVLLLITSSIGERSQASKLFEYVASKKPILIYGARGETEQALSGLGIGGFVYPGDRAELLRLLQQWRSGKELNPDFRIEEWLEWHERGSLSSQFLRHVDQTCMRRDSNIVDVFKKYPNEP